MTTGVKFFDHAIGVRPFVTVGKVLSGRSRPWSITGGADQGYVVLTSTGACRFSGQGLLAVADGFRERGIEV